jgi:hypothetical protein
VHGFTREEARPRLDLAIDWGRDGELSDFDADTGQLKLDPGVTLAPADHVTERWTDRVPATTPALTPGTPCARGYEGPPPGQG